MQAIPTVKDKPNANAIEPSPIVEAKASPTVEGKDSPP